MAVLSAQIATNTTTTTQLIVSGTSAGQFPNVVGQVGDPIPAVIENHDATNPVYLGNSTVSSTTGLKLAAAGSLKFQFVGTDATTLFAISTGGAVTVGVLLERQ